MSNEKQKLTLSVEKELVEKAKKLGVNISEITEKVLKHISETKIKDVVAKEELNEAYKKLFAAMLPALKKFNTPVVVGTIEVEMRHKEGNIELYPDTVLLLNSGKLWMDELQATPNFEAVYFYPPKEILSTYIDCLIKASERNKETLKELEIFRRVIEALTETTAPEYLKEKS